MADLRSIILHAQQGIRAFNSSGPQHAVETQVLVAVAVLVATAYVARRLSVYRKLAKIPIVNGVGFLGSGAAKSKDLFLNNARELVKQGFSKSKDVFRMRTDLSTIFVLSPHYADQIKNDDRFSPGKYTERELLVHTPGFEPFKVAVTERELVQEVVRSRLNRSLDKVAEATGEETADALQKHWTDSADWHEVGVYPSLLQVVAQTSSRAFLGPELCRDPDWLRITTEYTVSAITSVSALRQWPIALRPIVHWFLPRLRAVRRQLDEARAIMQPIVDKRRKQMADGTAPDDAIVWFAELSKGRPYDPAVSQLTMSVAAVHSTTDLLTQVLLELAKHPELIQPLRDEVVSVIGSGGWTKAAFYHLKLMDSVLKETQRLKPISQVFMKSVALQDVRLSDGKEIPKGSLIAVSAHEMWEPSNYENPDSFDGYRYVKRQQDPELARTSQFVSWSAEHVGFGFGKHACPGRFFVGVEAKAILAHLLLKYDFELPEGRSPSVMSLGFELLTDHAATLLVRRRKEEMEL